MSPSPTLVPENVHSSEHATAAAASPVPLMPPAFASGIVPAPPVTRFDREKLFLYATALLAITLVTSFYVFGYLMPALAYGKAIVNAAQSDENLSRGCYLQWLEHANRLQSTHSIRFMGMLIGMVITFIGMVFTIKGLEAGYSLDLNSGSNTASLRTASPGLVLCTLGIALCAAAMLHTTNHTFQMSTQCLS